jgi:hypothetical protein
MIKMENKCYACYKKLNDAKEIFSYDGEFFNLCESCSWIIYNLIVGGDLFEFTEPMLEDYKKYNKKDKFSKHMKKKIKPLKETIINIEVKEDK